VQTVCVWKPPPSRCALCVEATPLPVCYQGATPIPYSSADSWEGVNYGL